MRLSLKNRADSIAPPCGGVQDEHIYNKSIMRTVKLQRESKTNAACTTEALGLTIACSA